MKERHITPEYTGKEKGVVNQDSEDLPEITEDEIKNAFRNMKLKNT